MRWFTLPMLIVLAAIIILLAGCGAQQRSREVPDAGLAFFSRLVAWPMAQAEKKRAGEAEIVYDEMVIRARPPRRPVSKKKSAARTEPRPPLKAFR